MITVAHREQWDAGQYAEFLRLQEEQGTTPSEESYATPLGFIGWLGRKSMYLSWRRGHLPSSFLEHLAKRDMLAEHVRVGFVALLGSMHGHQREIPPHFDALLQRARSLISPEIPMDSIALTEAGTIAANQAKRTAILAAEGNAYGLFIPAHSTGVRDPALEPVHMLVEMEGRAVDIATLPPLLASKHLAILKTALQVSQPDPIFTNMP